MSASAKRIRATAQRRCPVCGRGSSCNWQERELYFCIGLEGDPPDGFVDVKKSRTDGNGFRHLKRDDREPPRSPTPAKPKKLKPSPKAAEPPVVKSFTNKEKGKKLTAKQREELAASLNLPDEATLAIPFGWDDEAYTHPEVDGTGEVVGIARRFPNGKKGQVPDGHRGLIQFDGWHDRPGPLFVTEGMSDGLAASFANLCCVARSNAGHGADLLAEMLKDWPRERDIVVIGDNDKAGREGANKVATELVALLNRTIRVAFPPDGDKDVRAHLTSDCWGDTPWPERGEKLRAHFEDSATVVDPPKEAPTEAEPGPSGGPILNTRRMDQVTPMPVDWLWFGRVAMGMFHMLDGDPGKGKSTIMAYIAACLTTGRRFPGCELAHAPAAVAFLGTEDSAEHTLRPRLEAAGADLSRCHIIDEVDVGDRTRPLAFPDDLPFVEHFVTANGVKLVIIDPIMGFLNGRVDTHKDDSSRQLLHPLKVLAERTGAAVVALRHLNKANGGSAVYRGGGSIAFTAAARVVLTVGTDPNRPDDRYLAVTKINIGATAKSIRYSLAPAVIGGISTSVVAWGAESDLTADDIVTRPSTDEKQGKAQKKAEEFLRRELAGGAVPTGELLRRAEKEEIAKRTLWRAKRTLNIEARKSGASGNWMWELPPGEGEVCQDEPDMADMAAFEEFKGIEEGCQPCHPARPRPVGRPESDDDPLGFAHGHNKPPAGHLIDPGTKLPD